MNKQQKERFLYSLKYQYGTIKTTDKAKKLFNKDLNDLNIPPGNKLEQLTGSRQGQFSIRINNKWRICFYWENGIASFVEMTDYH